MIAPKEQLKPKDIHQFELLGNILSHLMKDISPLRKSRIGYYYDTQSMAALNASQDVFNIIKNLGYIYTIDN